MYIHPYIRGFSEFVNTCVHTHIYDHILLEAAVCIHVHVHIHACVNTHLKHSTMCLYIHISCEHTHLVYEYMYQKYRHRYVIFHI